MHRNEDTYRTRRRAGTGSARLGLVLLLALAMIPMQGCGGGGILGGIGSALGGVARGVGRVGAGLVRGVGAVGGGLLRGVGRVGGGILRGAGRLLFGYEVIHPSQLKDPSTFEEELAPSTAPAVAGSAGFLPDELPSELRPPSLFDDGETPGSIDMNVAAGRDGELPEEDPELYEEEKVVLRGPDKDGFIPQPTVAETGTLKEVLGPATQT